MKRVVIESPFAAETVEGRERNRRYLLACLRDSLSRGEAPFASHAMLPCVLDDDVPEQRRLGMEAGFAWGLVADETALYVDLGVSPGMMEGAERARAAGRPVTPRSIPDWERLIPESSPVETPAPRAVKAPEPSMFDLLRSRANLREVTQPRIPEAQQDVEVVGPVTPTDIARLTARPSVPDDEIQQLIDQTVSSLPEPPQS